MNHVEYCGRCGRKELTMNYDEFIIFISVICVCGNVLDDIDLEE